MNWEKLKNLAGEVDAVTCVYFILNEFSRRDCTSFIFFKRRQFPIIRVNLT